MTFTDILDQFGVPYLTEGHHHCRPGWVQLDCPFCGKGSGKYHMGFSIEGGYVSCWRCRGHSLLSTLAEATGEDRDRLRKMLQGLETVRGERKDVRGTLTLPKGIGDLERIHKTYLRSRGFNVKELRELWGLQGLGMAGRLIMPDKRRINLAWRIFIPIKLDGEIVSWTTRAVSEKVDQRYISAPAECEAMNHKELLFGEDHARHAVCCVEGPFDAMRIGPGAVASCGTGFRRAQVARLARYHVRGVCFDNEPDAQRRARELVDMLSPFPGETYLINIDSADPGEATDREVAMIRKTLGL